MCIFVDENTKVIYQGLTGSQGKYYGLLNRTTARRSWRAPTPRRPAPMSMAFRSSRRLLMRSRPTGATASCVFIPAPGVKDAVMEAAEGGVKFIVVITEGVPAHDEAWFYNKLKRDFPTCGCSGPTAPASSRRANATSVSLPGTSPRPVGRSAS